MFLLDFIDSNFDWDSWENPLIPIKIGINEIEFKNRFRNE